MENTSLAGMTLSSPFSYPAYHQLHSPINQNIPASPFGSDSFYTDKATLSTFPSFSQNQNSRIDNRELLLLGIIKSLFGVVSATGNRFLFRIRFMPALIAEFAAGIFETLFTGCLLKKNSSLKTNETALSWGSALSTATSTILVALYSATKRGSATASCSKAIPAFIASLGMNIGIGFAEGWLAKKLKPENLKNVS